MSESERPKVGEPCGHCGAIAESMTAEPYDRIVTSRGWLEYMSVSYTVQPCGDVYHERIKTSDGKAKPVTGDTPNE